MKVRAQSLGQKPRGDVEVFVVRLGELPALGARLFERGRDIGNAIACRQRGPSAGEEVVVMGGCGVQGSLGLMTILASRGESSLNQGAVTAKRENVSPLISARLRETALVSLWPLRDMASWQVREMASLRAGGLAGSPPSRHNSGLDLVVERFISFSKTRLSS